MSESLSLRLWREVGRHDDLQSALSAAVEIVGDDLSRRVVAIRYLIAEHRLWETVAIAGNASHGPLVGTDPVSEGSSMTLPAELRRQRTVPADAKTFARRYPGVLPNAAQGPVLLAVLSDEPHVTGVLVFSGLGKQEVSPKLRGVVQAMTEPLASALRHHVRQRDAMTLREAAEADRRSLLSKLGRSEISDVVVGADAGLRDVMERVAQVARSNAPVLLLGETGSGKEVVAREVHRGSDRAAGPFVRVNCGAIPGDLIDSELFGHERGSFTGAVSQRKGWFERADGGTLFLDEVAELPLPAQVRLLRVLQDGLVLRVGGEEPITVDVRVIAATNQDLRTMMREGRFREDLWYRLAVFPINLPSLRDRIGDLPALAMHFAQRAAARLGLPVRTPTEQDTRLLCAYGWPGNIRELGSVIERAAILGNGRRLDVSNALGTVSPAPTRQLQVPPGEPPGSRPEARAFATLDEQARAHIESALGKCLGRVDGPFGAALLLGLNAQTLRSRMKKLGIDAASFRPGRTGG